MTRPDQGLTVIEVLVALSLLAVLGTAAVATYVSTLRVNQSAALSSRASQLIAAVTAQVNQHAITVPAGTSEVRFYTPTNFTAPVGAATAGSTCTLPEGSRNYCVIVSNTTAYNPLQGSTTVLSSPAELYTIRACWRNQGGVACAEADTIY